MNNKCSNKIEKIIETGKKCKENLSSVIPNVNTVSPTNTYGRIYDATETPIALVASTPQEVPLGSIGEVNNIITTTLNRLTIPSNGVYLIDYYFSASPSANASVTVELTQNTTSISNTSVTRSMTTGNDSIFSSSTIIKLNKGDEIALSIDSTTGVTVTPSSGTSAYINILKIA